ncbi:hypothetical protein R5H32_19435, partial [Defluviimonas sp. D31]|nr:hypothetical protein [Defluviimonas sp. D31]
PAFSSLPKAKDAEYYSATVRTSDRFRCPFCLRDSHIVVARGPAIVSRAALYYDGSVDDAAKITAKLSELASLGIVTRDGA